MQVQSLKGIVKKVDSETPVMSYVEGFRADRDNQMLFQEGGGKRGREGGGDKYSSKTQRLRELHEELNTLEYRIGASPIKSFAIDNFVKAFKEISTQVQSNPLNVSKELFQKLTPEDLKQFAKNITSSHGIGTRLKVPVEKAFEEHFGNMSVLKNNIKLCEQHCTKVIEMIIASQYADTYGDIDWTAVIDAITKAKKRTAPSRGVGTDDLPERAEQSDEEMLPANGGDDGTGGGGGDEKGSKGRGRPKKNATVG